LQISDSVLASHHSAAIFPPLQRKEEEGGKVLSNQPSQLLFDLKIRVRHIAAILTVKNNTTFIARFEVEMFQ
jgi:hypothetical protein